MPENKRPGGDPADQRPTAQQLVAAASLSPRQTVAAHARLRGRRVASDPPEDSMPRLAEPQRYDESGFPIAHRRASFAERVRRLLAG
jgi:hypothetical protein